MDDLIEKVNNIENKKINDKKMILIAPSHQEDNILESCIDEMLNQLLDKDYKIIVRPHPQFIRRSKQKIDELLEKYKDKFNEDFYFETRYFAYRNYEKKSYSDSYEKYQYKDSLIELEHPIELELNAKHNEINSIRLQNKNINTKINEIETGFKNYILSNENSEILKLIFEAFGVDIKTSENKNTKKLV